ncbi:uncharacterized protein LACBIDRAFT_329011 [Laccaria bicolor S238N-H82]|uniref:Predicted protein n=1 Tax=Laccaria bicolor (strain S238N-H82 / ATCC MYA-4686) TaxID=486041 RepID=B0DGR8_LACBS|nr:uncharacterized protein LACBIDRAFT_329011 [Laccaria bicolor S238N-H82]EDR06319.1 predicted protein [Laccaria bicolor S238N-H82]|eukprot:XP_001883180.1 predicted protein [Laccaria bicolor S238N-H82]
MGLLFLGSKLQICCRERPNIFKLMHSGSYLSTVQALSRRFALKFCTVLCTAVCTREFGNHVYGNAKHLYYRLYTKDGTIHSFNPIYSNDPSISRILPKSITPPHTALSLKKHLCKIEGMAGSNAVLFEAMSSDAAIPDSTWLKLCSHLGVGVSFCEPMALVVGIAEVEKRSIGPDQAEEVQSRFLYFLLYYRLYDEEGEVKSKTAFDGNDASLGRVDTLSIMPPHNMASLKSCIVKAEHIVDREIQLFEDTNGEAVMKDADWASLLAETFPSCLQGDPLSLVYGPKKLGQGSIMRLIRTNTYCSKYNLQRLAHRILMLVIQGPYDQSISTWHAHDEGDIVCHDNTAKSVQRIVGGISKTNPIPLQMQLEMHDGKTLKKTAPRL